MDNLYKGEEHISSGRITDIYENNFEFYHTLDARNGSSGSPICLLKNGKVIGVHKARRANNQYGKLSIHVASFIGVIIDEIEDDYYLLPKINNYDDNKFGFNSSSNYGLTPSRKKNLMI